MQASILLQGYSPGRQAGEVLDGSALRPVAAGAQPKAEPVSVLGSPDTPSCSGLRAERRANTAICLSLSIPKSVIPEISLPYALYITL